MSYQPKQGDLIMLNFTPQAGHEQAGRRPALIVSGDDYHRFTRLAIVCPVTNQHKDYPMHIPLDTRTKTTGEILCEHVKSLDLNARNASFIERLPEDILETVLQIIALEFQ